VNDDETREFRAKLMTADEFEARKRQKMRRVPPLSVKPNADGGVTVQVKRDYKGTCSRCSKREATTTVWMEFKNSTPDMPGVWHSVCDDCVKPDDKRQIPVPEGIQRLANMQGSPVRIITPAGTTTAQPQLKGTDMSTNKTAPNKSANKPAPTPPTATTTAKPTNGSDAAKGDGKKKAKRARVRWVSPKDPTFWVRSYKDVTDKHGAPMDPWGNKMEARVAAAFGLSPEEKEARAKAKAEEKARLEAMTPEQKLEFAQKKKEERAAKRNAKKEKERQAMIEQIRREIAEGKL
jgi:hypothetical protein